MRRTWLPVSRRRPSLGLTPPTTGSPATPPRPLSIFRRRVPWIAGAVILFGPQTSPLLVAGEKADAINIYRRVERRENRLRDGSVILWGPKRENPPPPPIAQASSYRRFWSPVSRFRPTLGFNPPSAAFAVRAPRYFRVASTPQPRFAGRVVRFDPPNLGLTPGDPTAKTDRRLRVYYRDRRGFAGRVLRFEPNREGTFIPAVPSPFQIYYPNISFIPTGRANFGEPRRTDPPLPVNTNVKVSRVSYGHHKEVRGRVFSWRPSKTNPPITGTLNHGLIRITNFQISLNVKREVDSGEVNAVSTDVGGTAVLFNKAFKDVDSITVTPESTTACYAIYDFNDIPNPTGFSVYVFDTAGNRISKLVSWKARGIV